MYKTLVVGVFYCLLQVDNNGVGWLPKKKKKEEEEEEEEIWTLREFVNHLLITCNFNFSILSLL